MSGILALVATFVRYFSLAGADDDDPIVTQPVVVDTKVTPYGPIITGFSGSVLINAWEVNNDGVEVTPSPLLALTIGIVTLNKLKPASRPPGSALAGSPAPMFRWGRGPLVTAVEAGEWIVESQLGDVVGFQVVITSHEIVADRWLAIWADRGPR